MYSLKGMQSLNADDPAPLRIVRNYLEPFDSTLRDELLTRENFKTQTKGRS